MLLLKDLLEVIDINTLCKLIDINGKILINNKPAYEISELYDQYNKLYVINCSVTDNCLYIFLDMDKRT